MKILFASIHNNEKNIHTLHSNIKNKIICNLKHYECGFIELHEQKENTLTSTTVILRKFKQFIWGAYYNIVLGFSIKHVAMTFIKQLTSAASYNKKIVNIESIVTSKHIKAWQYFIDKTQFDYIIVFESDLIIDETRSVNALEKLLQEFKREKNIYIDLAGGFPVESIMSSTNLYSLNVESNAARKFCCNTACAYLMSRQLIINILSTEGKLTEHFPIDFYINYKANTIKNKILCVHPKNRPFGHGSFISGNNWRDTLR